MTVMVRSTRRRLLGAGIATAALLAGVANSQAQSKVEATFAGILAPNHIITRGMEMLAQKAAEKSGGTLIIRVVHSGQLGGLKETMEATIAGNLEMTQVNNSSLGAFLPATMLFDLPFVFRDNDHMRKVVRGEIGQKIYADFAAKTGMMIMMSGLADGPRSVWNRTRPVRSPDDMKGLKLRVMESPIMVDTFRALGAIPTPMPFPEVYMAAKQSVIDGAETPPAGLIQMKAPEVARYYSLTKHFALPAAVGVNAKWFNGLSAAHRRALIEAADEARDWYDAAYEADDAQALAEARRQGMEINEVIDLRQFQASVRSVYDRYADRVGGLAMIERVLAVR
jgi:tripartite ATP-independent transporter DctP family solute receptor